jgi:uncharacterized peroxidase-related enzyme
MRLQVLDDGQRLRARLFLRVAARLGGNEVDDVAKTALYRPEFFGRPWLTLLREVMRGPSYWTPAERELIGAATSKLNDCSFCARVHTQTADIESADGQADPRPTLAALLVFLEKLTVSPDSVTASDVESVRAAGVPDEAIVDAIHVNFIFNTVNRLAHSFDYTWKSDDHLAAGAQALHRFGYRLPGVLVR